MNTFIKAQTALIAGSLADFIVTILLVQLFNYSYITGNAVGNVTGAIAQFILSRKWVFTAAKQKTNTSTQIIKFVVMWIGNIALSAFGVYVLTQYMNVHYLLSKVIISAIIGVSYTYLMSKKFVFA